MAHAVAVITLQSRTKFYYETKCSYLFDVVAYESPFDEIWNQQAFHVKVVIKQRKVD